MFIDGHESQRIDKDSSKDTDLNFAVPAYLGVGYTNNTGRLAWESLDGALDDFRVYNRALSSSEIAQLANP